MAARERTRRTGRRPSVRLRLRTTSLADLPLLVRHCRRMWEDIGGRSRAALNRADPAYRRWVRRQIEAGRFVGFVVEDAAGTPAGSGGIWISPVHPRPGRLRRLTMPYILSMYTDPRFRRRGVARRIVRAMVRWARARGYRRIYLHASRMGRGVYAGLGFVSGSEMRREL